MSSSAYENCLCITCIRIFGADSCDYCKCVADIFAVLRDRVRCMVVVGSHSHKVCAIDSMTGQAIWTCVLPDRVESSACLSHCARHVFVGE